MAEPKHIVVVGASAGGFNSIVELCAQFSDKMHFAVFIVLHLPASSNPEVLLYKIRKLTSFNCKVAEDNDDIEDQTIYLAPPDKHLLVRKGRTALGNGPAENRWRPSIDVLFRSAAAAYNGGVIGIILSGMMEDGTAGMLAVRKSGGTCIVQDPEQAEYPDMPQSVLLNMAPDYCLRLEEMGAVIAEKTRNGADTFPVPHEVMAEASIAERAATGIDNVKELGDHSDFVCPDCGGTLFEIKDGELVRYRCYTGHVYNERELLLKQSEKLDSTLWVALRMMEERRNLLKKMSGEEAAKGWAHSSENKRQRYEELQEHIDRIKQILFSQDVVKEVTAGS